MCASAFPRNGLTHEVLDLRLVGERPVLAHRDHVDADENETVGRPAGEAVRRLDRGSDGPSILGTALIGEAAAFERRDAVLSRAIKVVVPKDGLGEPGPRGRRVPAL